MGHRKINFVSTVVKFQFKSDDIAQCNAQWLAAGVTKICRKMGVNTHMHLKTLMTQPSPTVHYTKANTILLFVPLVVVLLLAMAWEWESMKTAIIRN